MPPKADLSKTLIYANGFNRHCAAKMGKFIFQDFFKNLEVDNHARMFIFYVHEYIEDSDGRVYFAERFDKNFRDYFKDFWGSTPGFMIKVIETKDESVLTQ